MERILFVFIATVPHQAWAAAENTVLRRPHHRFSPKQVAESRRDGGGGRSLR